MSKESRGTSNRGRIRSFPWSTLGTLLALGGILVTITIFLFNLKDQVDVVSKKVDDTASTSDVSGIETELGEKLDDLKFRVKELGNKIIEYDASIYEARSALDSFFEEENNIETGNSKKEEEKRIVDAIDEITDAIEGFREVSPAILFSLLGHAYRVLGTYYEQIEEPDKSRKALRKSFDNLKKAHQKDQREGDYLFDMGYVKTQLCDHTEAINHLDKYVNDYNGEDPHGYFNIAYNYHMLDRYNKAMEVYLRATDLDKSQGSSVFFNIGAMYSLKGDVSRAKINIKRSLEISKEIADGNEKVVINRICIIKEAMRPLDVRGYSCDYHKASDLTNLSNDSEFVEWFNAKKLEILGGKECSSILNL